MYTIDNSINTLQDLMQHIWKLSRIEPAIFNNYCAILAVRKGTEEERKAPCFTDGRIAKHCYDFLHSMMRGAMLEGTFTNTCGNGLRCTMIGMTIGNDNYYVMLDKYLLTSDITEGWEAHEQTATEVIGTNDMLNYAHELYKSRTIITKQQEEELINVMMHCMNELASRDILDEEVERAEKIVN